MVRLVSTALVALAALVALHPAEAKMDVVVQRRAISARASQDLYCVLKARGELMLSKVDSAPPVGNGTSSGNGTSTGNGNGNSTTSSDVGGNHTAQNHAAMPPTQHQSKHKHQKPKKAHKMHTKLDTRDAPKAADGANGTGLGTFISRPGVNTTNTGVNGTASSSSSNATSAATLEVGAPHGEVFSFYACNSTSLGFEAHTASNGDVTLYGQLRLASDETQCLWASPHKDDATTLGFEVRACAQRDAAEVQELESFTLRATRTSVNQDTADAAAKLQIGGTGTTAKASSSLSHSSGQRQSGSHVSVDGLEYRVTFSGGTKDAVRTYGYRAANGTQGALTAKQPQPDGFATHLLFQNATVFN